MAFLRDFLSEVKREAECVVELERVLAGYNVCAFLYRGADEV